MTDKPHDRSSFGYDFGDDAGESLPSDPNFDAWVSAQAPSVNAPTDTPRLEMWDAIQARQETARVAQSGAIPGVLPFRRMRWVLPSAIAAALLVGIGVDRLSLRSIPSTATQPAPARVASTGRATTSPAIASEPQHGRSTERAPRTTRPGAEAALPAPSADPARLYRLAAVQTLTQAEALLTAYRASDLAQRNPAAAKQLGTWGREVLSSTRLLLDSPAGDDPELRPLLDDLELVLVQVIRLSGAPLDASERALIDRAMRERDLLPRIRSAVPAGIAGAASE